MFLGLLSFDGSQVGTRKKALGWRKQCVARTIARESCHTLADCFAGHGFRAFQPVPHEHAHINGHGAPARPTSQPVETDMRGPAELDRREIVHDGRPGIFRPYGEPLPPRAEPQSHRVERPPFNGLASHPQERPQFSSSHTERDRGPSQAPTRFQPGGFGGGETFITDRVCTDSNH